MEYIIAMYFSAWLIQLWTLFVPVMKTLPQNNYVSKHKVLCYMVLIIMTPFLVIFLLPAMLSDNNAKRFKISFRKGLLGE